MRYALVDREFVVLDPRSHANKKRTVFGPRIHRNFVLQSANHIDLRLRSRPRRGFHRRRSACDGHCSSARGNGVHYATFFMTIKNGLAL